MLLNRDPQHAAVKHLPASWTVFDEIYQLKNYEKSKVRELLVLDRLILNADDIKAKKATPGDYPVAWGKKFGSGKVFYTSLGHREDVWDPTVTERVSAPTTAAWRRRFSSMCSAASCGRSGWPRVTRRRRRSESRAFRLSFARSVKRTGLLVVRLIGAWARLNGGDRCVRRSGSNAAEARP